MCIKSKEKLNAESGRKRTKNWKRQQLVMKQQMKWRKNKVFKELRWPWCAAKGRGGGGIHVMKDYALYWKQGALEYFVFKSLWKMC